MATGPPVSQAVPMNRPDHPTLVSLLTHAEYERYRGDLDELRRVRDRDLPELLRDARGFVASDAEEEIAQIRDDHRFVDARIAHLDALLRHAEVIADGAAVGVAFPGRIVDVEYTRSGKRATYRIAGAGSPGTPRTVSAGSPVGQGLLGRVGGDLVSVELPNGRTEEIHILAVRSDDDGLAAA